MAFSGKIYSSRNCLQYVASQHRQTPHRPPKLSAGRRPVALSVSAIDLIEYKVSEQGFHNVLSVFDYLARFLILVPLVDKLMSAGVRALVDHSKVRKMIWAKGCSASLVVR